MADSTPKVKHITLECPVAKCDGRAFVQVLVVGDAIKQKKIDALARKKLRTQLTDWHEEGLHD